MIQKSVLTQVLKILAITIEGMEQEEVELLVSGKGKLIFAASEKSKNVKAESSTGFNGLMRRLESCKDRDEARQILSSVVTKGALLSLAKAQKIYISKSDRREDVESKIVEFVIGAKLRTEAIQTLNLKGGGQVER